MLTPDAHAPQAKGPTRGLSSLPGHGRAQASPFPDEFRHFLLHLFALQLLLKQQFEPSHGAIALGVLLISLERKQKHDSLGDGWNHWKG